MVIKKEVKRKYSYALCLLLTIYILPIISAPDVEIGNNDEVFGVEIVLPEDVTNVTNLFINNTNASNFWITNIGSLGNVNVTQFNNNAGTLNINESWITAFGNELWCALTGCTMESNINMGGNNITNASVIIANSFIGDGSGLTNISGLSANEFNMYFTTSMKNQVTWNFSESDDSVVNVTMEAGDHYIFRGDVF